MTEREYTAVYQQDEEWIVAWAEELPGSLGQGRTIEEARQSLRESIELLLEVNKELGTGNPEDDGGVVLQLWCGAGAASRGSAPNHKAV
ncbi:MAG TPA: type II toxin-antitoxin system HicB family antitoxin [Burkholderiales bacterium]|nr:type II toxin-antitoxin system HicB family antitoxin [Burkholderiales bacterium]